MVKPTIRVKAILASLFVILSSAFVAATPAIAAPASPPAIVAQASTIVAEAATVATVTRTPEAVGQALRVTYGCLNGNNTRICIYTCSELWTCSEYYWTAANYYLDCVNIGSTFNNKAKSAFAYTNYYRARFYTGAGCTGTQVTLVGYGGFANCTNTYSTYWNATASPCSAPNVSSFFVD